MKVRLTAEARAQVQAIVRDISLENPAAALKWARQFQKIAERLGQFPHSGQTVEGEYEEAVRHVRHVRHGMYGIFYEVTDKFVVILAVWHSARRPPGRGIAGALEDE